MKKLKRISEDKEIKKVFSESQVMMLLEKMDDHIQLVAEGLIGLERRMGEVEANQKIALKHLFRTDDRLEKMEKELKEIRSELAKLNKKTPSAEIIKDLSGRIAVIEEDMKKYQIFISTKTGMRTA